MLGGSFLTFGETPVAIFDNPDTPVFVYEREGAVLGYAFCVLRHQEEGNPGAKAFYEAQGMAPQYTSMELLCK